MLDELSGDLTNFRKCCVNNLSASHLVNFKCPCQQMYTVDDCFPKLGSASIQWIKMDWIKIAR